MNDVKDWQKGSANPESYFEQDTIENERHDNYAEHEEYGAGKEDSA
jgi:hypothetical protein